MSEMDLLTHSDIWNTSYGQKKGQEDHGKAGTYPIPLRESGV
jgi:hypothetical protein